MGGIPQLVWVFLELQYLYFFPVRIYWTFYSLKRNDLFTQKYARTQYPHNCRKIECISSEGELSIGLIPVAGTIAMYGHTSHTLSITVLIGVDTKISS